ncbi:hypothetical protein [Neisseria bacilliformis]|nr:hypothetical protein [Neisseria bacilliformis]
MGNPFVKSGKGGILRLFAGGFKAGAGWRPSENVVLRQGTRAWLAPHTLP